ncbi:MAG: PAS domain-containing protein, partial [Leptospiraceae bacterium]|nr:PAS domain-containing protein [Leptospiraceae bacterium]
MDEINRIESSFPVVAIGASAGGLKALEEFFQFMPEDSGAAFVVIQHLSPDFKSLMKELLERKTGMNVKRIQNGMSLNPNTIYLITPRNNLIIENHFLKLIEQEEPHRQHPNFPIDLFFQSLAIDFRDNAVGIILSGTGSDGTRGIQAISETGGLTFVQSPVTAEFDGMPQSAITSGYADHVLSPSQIAGTLYKILKEGRDLHLPKDGSFVDISSSDLKKVISIINVSENFDFSNYKPSTLIRRISRRISLSACERIQDYMNLLISTEEERIRLREDLMIGVTRFFRDPESWEILETKIIPDTINTIKEGEQLRVWIPACSTGEEAYSMAMLIDECLSKMNKSIIVKIFATDIDNAALGKAAEGIYSPGSITNISPHRLEKYFLLRSGNYHVSRKLREMIIFAPHNLAKNAGFSRVHLVSCRNVLIYMLPTLQQRVLRMLHFSLEVNGVLFLGSAEAPGDLSDEFFVIDEKNKLYRKKRDIRFVPLGHSYDYSIPSVHHKAKVQDNTRKELYLNTAFSLYMKSEGNSAFFVNRNNEIIHILADELKLLKLLEGELTRHINHILLLDLNVPVNTAIHRARRERHNVQYSGITINVNDLTQNLNIQVMFHDQIGGEDVLLVIIQVSKLQNNSLDNPKIYDLDDNIRQRITELEFELQQTRENLQTTIEELETTNEEQQATNEELLASNEELQSTNEELHSVNEELYTVNTEYQIKIKQLTELTNDIENLLRSTNIGVVFLDRELKIRKFTPAASIAINLLESDIKRPLKHITHNLDCPDLIPILKLALDTEKAIEKEVQLINNNDIFLMRVNPYKREDGICTGLVISFININEIKKVEEQLQRRTRELETFYSTAPLGLALFDMDKRFIRMNNLFNKVNNTSSFQYLGKTPRELFGEIGKEIENLLESVKMLNKPVFNKEIQYFDKDTNILITWLCNCYPADLADGYKVIGFTTTDITELKNTQVALYNSELRFRHVVENIREVLFVISRDGQMIYINSLYEEIWGKSRESVYKEPDSWFEAIDGEDRVRIKNSLYFHLKNGKEVDEIFKIRDGKDNQRWIQMRTYPVKEGDEFLYFVGIAED